MKKSRQSLEDISEKETRLKKLRFRINKKVGIFKIKFKSLFIPDKRKGP